MPIGTAQRIYYSAKKRSGVNRGRGIHTLRHCFATHLIDAGVDVYTVKRMMGHASLSTTAKYVHVTKEKISKIVSPLDRHSETDSRTGPGHPYRRKSRTAIPENAERRTRMPEIFENCESVFVEKTDAKDFSRFTPAIVRKPEDPVLPPFTTDYFENNGSLEKLPILPERGNPANVEVGDILRLFGETYMRGNGVSREQGKVVSRLSACRTHVLGGHVEQCDSECENCFSPSTYAKNDFCTPAATATVRSARAWQKRNGWRPGRRNCCRVDTFTRCSLCRTF